MKWMKGVAVVAGMLALMIAGCGGGSTPSSSDTPAASSAKTMNVLGGMSSLLYESMFGIMGTYEGGAAIVAKSLETLKVGEEPRISCNNWIQVAAGLQFECVVWDSLGSATSADHKCDITGVWASPAYQFDLTYDCENFNPDSDVTVDGSYTVVFTISEEAFASQTVKACLGKHTDTTKAVAECAIEDAATEFESDGATCSWNNETTPLCATQDALFSAQITIGADGVTVVDPCGTFNFGAGTTMTTTGCTPTQTLINMTFTLNGTFNGQVVSETYNVSCEGMI